MLQHRQRFPAYKTFNRQLDTLLPVKNKEEENAKSDKGVARDARCIYAASSPQKTLPQKSAHSQ